MLSSEGTRSNRSMSRMLAARSRAAMVASAATDVFDGPELITTLEPERILGLGTLPRGTLTRGTLRGMKRNRGIVQTVVVRRRTRRSTNFTLIVLMVN